MSAIVIIIAIAVTGILLMRFRKRWLAKINIAVTNRITSLFAGWLPGFGILTHQGRKSGKAYRTPVNVFRASNGFIIALTYSSQSEWVKNVLAPGVCELKTVGKNTTYPRRTSCVIPRGGDPRFRCDRAEDRRCG
jgi:F420H(2)-dependent quinone reductase